MKQLNDYRVWLCKTANNFSEYISRIRIVINLITGETLIVTICGKEVNNGQRNELWTGL